MTKLSSYSKSTPVTKSQLIENLEFIKSEKFDLAFQVKGHKCHIHIDYDERVIPEFEKSGNDGVLALDITHIKMRYLQEKSSPEQLKNIIIETFENSNDYKYWLFHPREEIIHKRFKEESQRQEQQQILNTENYIKHKKKELEEQKNNNKDISKIYKSSNINKRKIPAKALVYRKEKATLGIFTCSYCNYSWPEKSTSFNTCPECDNQANFLRECNLNCVNACR